MDNLTCSFSECGRVIRAKGLCTSHYQQQHKGLPLVPLNTTRGRPRLQATREEFFWARVQKSEECWLWTGAKASLGYGQIKFQGKTGYAYRYSYELHVGEIPTGYVIDHLCHVPACVRPEHLRAVTHKSNMENRKSAHSNSSSGVRGVHWVKRVNKWRAEVRHNSKNIFLGHFDSVEEAEVVVVAKRAELFEVSS